MEEYETVLLVKQEVFMFQIPPRATNRGYRAADWKLHNPDWTGRMRIVSKGKKCIVKLEDKTSGELFAQAPIDKHPGIAVEAVTDSSRYFVLRIEDDNGKAAFIGIGFADRGDSFDLNVTLQEHFKWIQNSEAIEKDLAATDGKSNLDLGFKEGQTIKINMNIGTKSSSAKPRPKTTSCGGVPGLLPPPPGGVRIPSAPKATTVSSSGAATSILQPDKSNTESQKNDLLSDLDTLTISSNTSEPPPANSNGTELWGDFATASGNSKQTNSTTNWLDF